MSNAENTNNAAPHANGFDYEAFEQMFDEPHPNARGRGLDASNASQAKSHGGNGSGASAGSAGPKSNYEFLHDMFGSEEKNVLVSSGGKNWTVHTAGRVLSSFPELESNYYSVSLFNRGKDKKLRRVKENFKKQILLVVDDVGTKLVRKVAEDLLPDPTYRLETSPGNEQWGYLFADGGVTDARVVTALVNAIIKNRDLNPSGKDPGMKGLTRVVRLPFGANHKEPIVAANGGRPWPHVMRSYHPKRVFTPDELAVAVGADLSPEGLEKAGKEGNLTDNVTVKKAMENGDWLLRFFHSRGELVDDEINDNGFVKIICPWAGDHSDPDDYEAGYRPGMTGFQCHHGHCEERTLQDVIDWADAPLTDKDRCAMAREAFDQIPDEEAEKIREQMSPGSKFPDDEPLDPWETYIVPTFPLDILPKSVADFVSANAVNTGADSSAVAWSTLCAFSTALDHQFSMKLKEHGDFDVNPRLWVMLVGDPSSKKTPAQKPAIAPLKRYEAFQREVYEQFADPETDPKPPRIVMGDTTIEALGSVLVRQSRGVMIHRDELSGWIGGMEKYSAGRAGASDRAFWLQAFDGGHYTVDRITRGENHIKNLSVSILGGIQPKRLAELRGLSSDGLLQRFIPVMMRAASYSQDIPTGPQGVAYEAMIKACLAVGPTTLRLTSDGVKAMEELHSHLFRVEQSSAGFADGFQGYVGKLAGIAGSLTIILHLMEHPAINVGLPVPRATVEKVSKLVREHMLPHAYEFYRSAESVTDGDRIQRLASWILTSGQSRIVPSDLTRNVALFRGLTVTAVNDGVSPLVASGWLKPERPGRDNGAWLVNPKLKAMFAARAAEEERRKEALAEVMGAPRRKKAPDAAEEQKTQPAGSQDAEDAPSRASGTETEPPGAADVW